MRLLRARFTILAMMFAVAISAIVLNWVRPIGRIEAKKIAEGKFLKIPGANRWIGRYRVQAGPGGTFDSDQPKRYADGWTVVFSDHRGGTFLAQYLLTPKGKLRAMDFAPGNFNDPDPTNLPVK